MRLDFSCDPRIRRQCFTSLLVSLGILSSLGCKRLIPYDDSDIKATTSEDDEKTLTLNLAIDTLTGAIQSPCFKIPTPTTPGEIYPISKAEVRYVKSASDLFKKVSMSVAGSTNLTFAKTDFQSAIESQLNVAKNALHFVVFAATSVTQSLSQNDYPRFVIAGAALADGTTIKDERDFRFHCGNSFISKITRSNFYLGILDVQYATRGAFLDAQASVEAKAGAELESLKGTFAAQSKQNNSEVTFSIRVLGTGGYSSYIPSAAAGGAADPGNNVRFLPDPCTMEKFDDCIETMKSMTAYASKPLTEVVQGSVSDFGLDRYGLEIEEWDIGAYVAEQSTKNGGQAENYEQNVSDLATIKQRIKQRINVLSAIEQVKSDKIKYSIPPQTNDMATFMSDLEKVNRELRSCQKINLDPIVCRTPRQLGLSKNYNQDILGSDANVYKETKLNDNNETRPERQYYSECPSDFVVGANGRAGAILNQIALQCGDPNFPNGLARDDLEPIGDLSPTNGEGFPLVQVPDPLNQVVVGFGMIPSRMKRRKGRPGHKGHPEHMGQVQYLEFYYCPRKSVTSGGNNEDCKANVLPIWGRKVVTDSTNIIISKSCPSQYAMVGFHGALQESGGVQALGSLGPICGKYEDPMAPLNDPPQTPPPAEGGAQPTGTP